MKIHNIIKNKQFDEERSLYNIKNTEIINCLFQGERDGESVLKEARSIRVTNTNFSLRYPLWHVQEFELLNSTLDEFTRAPIWYSHHGLIENTSINSIKMLRECSNIQLNHCHIDSKEFGWYCHDISISHCDIHSEYILMNTSNVKIDHLKFTGKYSFQYMKNLEITDSHLDTKDAFWHSQDVVIKNCIVKGEYLGWFSKNLTFINCEIIGTQPLCYCENLQLIDCKMIDTDLAFEYSDVDATIIGHIDSIKNVKSGRIIVDSVGEIINHDSIMEVNGQIIIRNS